MIKRIQYLLPLHAKLTLYNCLIIPLFDYGDIVWSDKNNNTLMGQLQVLQNKAAKVLLNLPPRGSSRWQQATGMATSYIIDLIHTKTNTRYLLRSNEGVLLKHPSGKMKKSFGDRSFSVTAPTLWNAYAASNVFLPLNLILKLIFLN